MKFIFFRIHFCLKKKLMMPLVGIAESSNSLRRALAMLVLEMLLARSRVSWQVMRRTLHTHTRLQPLSRCSDVSRTDSSRAQGGIRECVGSCPEPEASIATDRMIDAGNEEDVISLNTTYILSNRAMIMPPR